MTTFNQQVQRLNLRNMFLIEEKSLSKAPVVEFGTVDLSICNPGRKISTDKADFLARIIKSLHFLIELGIWILGLSPYNRYRADCNKRASCGCTRANTN
jgi:hypothetical protein